MTLFSYSDNVARVWCDTASAGGITVVHTITQRYLGADCAAAPRFHYPTCSPVASVLLCFGPLTLQKPLLSK